MQGRQPGLTLAPLGLMVLLAVGSPSGSAQDKLACQAYFQVVQMDARIAGGFVAGGNEAQKKWWEKKGQKRYSGLCWNGSVLSGDKPRYLLFWVSENHSQLEEVPTSQSVSGTVTGTDGNTGTFGGEVDGTKLVQEHWTTASISVLRVSPEGKVELPAIYFHTAGPSVLERYAAAGWRWSSDSQKALEAALKFLSEKP